MAQDLHQQGSSVSFCNDKDKYHLCKELQGPWVILVGNTTSSIMLLTPTAHGKSAQ